MEVIVGIGHEGGVVVVASVVNGDELLLAAADISNATNVLGEVGVVRSAGSDAGGIASEVAHGVGGNHTGEVSPSFLS